MGDDALSAARSCGNQQIKGYRGLTFPHDIVTRARENSLATRMCYAAVPDARDKRLIQEQKRAHRSLRINTFFRMSSPQERATLKTSLDSAYWIVPGSDLRYSNACVQESYRDPTSEAASFRNNFENMQLVYRCIEDAAERQTAQLMEVARTAAFLETSSDSSHPQLSMTRAAVAAIDDSAASCLIPRYRSYAEGSFAKNLVSIAQNNAEAIRACYQDDPALRDAAIQAERTQAQHAMKDNFFFNSSEPGEQSWLMAAIDAVILESKSVMAALRPLKQQKPAPHVATDAKSDSTVSYADRAAATGRLLLLFGKGLFTSICGGELGIPLTVGGAASGDPALGVKACTSVW